MLASPSFLPNPFERENKTNGFYIGGPSRFCGSNGFFDPQLVCSEAVVDVPSVLRIPPERAVDRAPADGRAPGVSSVRARHPRRRHEPDEWVHG